MTLTEIPPVAASAEGFGASLKTRVGAALARDVRGEAYRRLHRKGAIVAAWYAASYLAVVAANGWAVGVVACSSLALSIAAVGFNIQHDANHNAFFDAAAPGV